MVILSFLWQRTYQTRFYIMYRLYILMKTKVYTKLTLNCENCRHTFCENDNHVQKLSERHQAVLVFVDEFKHVLDKHGGRAKREGLCKLVDVELGVHRSLAILCRKLLHLSIIINAERL